MLEKYFSAPKTLKRLRIGPSAPYIPPHLRKGKFRPPDKLIGLAERQI